MAAINKMALSLFIFYSVFRNSKAHVSGDDIGTSYEDSYNAISSGGTGVDHGIRRRQGAEFDRPPMADGQEWQYEGLPIEAKRRNIETTTPSLILDGPEMPPINPPLHPRYRRIYNPDESASIEEFPFMAALLVNRQLWCGAAIIDGDKILTAAHCLQLQYNNRFFREYVKMLTVRVGSTNATAGGEVLKVMEISFHPNYKPETLEFNIALIRLHKNITFGKKEPFVDKIDYAREKILAIDSNVTFLGWGSVLGSGGIGGQILLQKLTLPVYDLADCQEIYGRELVTHSNFCAGFITLAKNVCNHDAGGPAILDNQLVGILSFSSRRCDAADQPAVFTSVGAVSGWVDELGEKRLMTN